MNREARIGAGVCCFLFGLILLPSETDLLRNIGIGLVAGGIVQFIRLPKDNILPFRKRRH